MTEQNAVRCICPYLHCYEVREGSILCQSCDRAQAPLFIIPLAHVGSVDGLEAEQKMLRIVIDDDN